jgi:hypothetical protein
MTMSVGKPWTVTGVSEETRRVAEEAARVAGLSLEEWVDRTLSEGARRTLGATPAPADRQDAAEPVHPLLARRRASEAGRGLSPIEAMRARMRRRRAL